MNVNGVSPMVRLHFSKDITNSKGVHNAKGSVLDFQELVL